MHTDNWGIHFCVAKMTVISKGFCHEGHLGPGDISQHIASFLPRQPEHVCDGFLDEESPRRLRFTSGFVCDSVPRETHLEWAWHNPVGWEPEQNKSGRRKHSHPCVGPRLLVHKLLDPTMPSRSQWSKSSEIINQDVLCQAFCHSNEMSN